MMELALRRRLDCAQLGDLQLATGQTAVAGDFQVGAKGDALHGARGRDGRPGTAKETVGSSRARWVSCLLVGIVFAGGEAHAQKQFLEPIKVGAISTLALFPESTAAARAYFDVVNAYGGVKGHRLQLIVEDDKGQPQSAAEAAQKLVERDRVVANVGSASALECAVNGKFYESKGLVSIQGTGADPGCFNSANVAPVNTGPYLDAVLGLRFLVDVRNKERVCLVAVAPSPIMKPAFESAVIDWTRSSGKKLAFAALGVSPTESIESLLRSVQGARCDGVVYTGIESEVIEWVKTASRLHIKGVDWVFLSPAYTDNVARTLGAEGEGIFAMSEFEPWSSRSGMLTDWRNVMVRGKVPLTSFSQGGYIAASIFVNMLRSIPGEITRESVTAAFKAMTPRTVSLIGTPFVFGRGTEHNPNRAAMPVRLETGKWVVAHFEYITQTESNRQEVRSGTAP